MSFFVFKTRGDLRRSVRWNCWAGILKTSIRSAAVLAACLLTFCVPAQATPTLLYSNWSPEWFVSRQVDGSQYGGSYAFPFVFGNGLDFNLYSFTEVKLSLVGDYSVSPSTLGPTVELLADDSGKPGAVLESWSNYTLSNTYGNLLPFTNVGPAPQLKAQQTYWIAVLKGGNGPTYWWSNNWGSDNRGATLVNNAWSVSNDWKPSIFQVFGTPVVGGGDVTVPEPATMLLFGLGLVGLAGMRRKFKN